MIENTESTLARIKIIYLLTTIFLVALSFFVYFKIINLIETSNHVNHANEINHSLVSLAKSISVAQSNQKNYLLTGDITKLAKRGVDHKTITNELKLIDSLTRDNAELTEKFKILQTLINEKISNQEKMSHKYIQVQIDPEFKLSLIDGFNKTENILLEINKMSALEDHLLTQRTQKYSRLSFIAPLFTIILSLGALFVLLISYFRIIKELKYSQQCQTKLEESNKEIETKNQELSIGAERFLKIFDNSPVAMTFAEIETNHVVYANPLFYSLFGYSKEEVIGHSTEELNLLSAEENKRLFPIILSHLEEDRSIEELKALSAEERALLLVKLKEKMLKNGYEILYTKKNGETFFAIVFVEVIDIGNKKYSLTTYQDITERKEAQKQLADEKAFAEMVIENDPSMIVVYDENLHIIAWNKKSEEFSGFKKEEVLGQSFFDLFPEFNKEEWLTAFNSVLKDGKSFHYSQAEIEQKKAFVESWLMPLRNTNQQIIGVLGITRDITETVEMTRVLEVRNVELQKINKELESINYISSHDLQEPLRQIQVFASRISDDEKQNLTDAGRSYFEKMNNAAERMQNLIADLLTYSRTKTEAKQFKTVNLNQIINQVKGEFAETIDEKKAIIEVDKLGEAKVIPFQFRQMIYNLIGNSLKFSKPDTPPHIIIKNKKVKSSQVPGADPKIENEYYHISITDNGIGFEPQYHERIFEVFQRLNAKEKISGTGIGLAIAKNIIENHNGFITATGKLNEGATIDIFIPTSQNH